MMRWFFPRNSPLQHVRCQIIIKDFADNRHCKTGRALPGDAEEDGVGDLASGAGDEHALGFVVEAGGGHGALGQGRHALGGA